MIELGFDVQGEFYMGTIIGLVILVAIDWYLVRKTGLHIHQLIAQKYAEHSRSKEDHK